MHIIHTNKSWTGKLAITLLLIGLSPANADNSLEQAGDLQQLAGQMRAKQLPLLLAFKADYCGYCLRLEAEQLKPLQISKEYADKVVIRTIDMSGAQAIKGFDGTETTAGKLSSHYKVNVAPTLLFLDADGKEVAERMLGYNTPEYYGAYLEQTIDAAADAIKGN